MTRTEADHEKLAREEYRRIIAHGVPTFVARSSWDGYVWGLANHLVRQRLQDEEVQQRKPILKPDYDWLIRNIKVSQEHGGGTPEELAHDILGNWLQVEDAQVVAIVRSANGLTQSLDDSIDGPNAETVWVERSKLEALMCALAPWQKPPETGA